MAELQYKIVGRRAHPGLDSVGNPTSVDYVDVEWSYKDGSVIEDYETVQVSVNPKEFELRKVGERKVVKDQFTVPAGTSDKEVEVLCERKKKSLAESLSRTHIPEDQGADVVIRNLKTVKAKK